MPRDEPDTAHSSTVTDHAFVPRTERVTVLPMYHGHVTVDPDHRKSLPPTPYLCGHPGCNLAESAHEETTVGPDVLGSSPGPR